jgi:hypothetical protein
MKHLPIILCAVILIFFSGCTYNRNAPLFQSDVTIQDSANGNTVPVSTVP